MGESLPYGWRSRKDQKQNKRKYRYDIHKLKRFGDEKILSSDTLACLMPDACLLCVNHSVKLTISVIYAVQRLKYTKTSDVNAS